MTDKEIIDKLCMQLNCDRDQILHKVIRLVIIDSCFCDKPEDRLYHAKDRTWWRRDEKGRLKRADPPQWQT